MTIKKIGPLFPVVLVGCMVFTIWGCVDDYKGEMPPTDSIELPLSIAIHPDGRYLYVVTSNSNLKYHSDKGGTVVVIDTDTLEILPEQTMTIGSFAGKLALNSDATRGYVPVRGNDSVTYFDIEENGLKISCQESSDSSNCMIRDIPKDPFNLKVITRERELAVSGPTTLEMLVVSHLYGGKVSLISMRDRDPKTASVVSRELVSGANDIEISPRTNMMYVTGRFSNEIVPFWAGIGPEGESVDLFPQESIVIQTPLDSFDIRGLAFSKDGLRAYAANRMPDSILVIDVSADDEENFSGTKNRLISVMDIGDDPSEIVVVDDEQGERLYVPCFDENAVYVVNPLIPEIIDIIHVGDGPYDIVLDTIRHKRAYVTNYRENSISVIDLDSTSERYHQEIARIK